MVKIAIFGSDGFVGSCLTRHLLDSGYEVLAIEMAPPNTKQIYQECPRLAISYMPSTSSHIIDMLNDHGIAAVINAIEMPHESQDDGAACSKYVVICEELARAVEMCYRNMMPAQQENFKYIALSSYCIYGSCEIGTIDERSPFRPSSLYAATLASAMLMAMSWHHSHLLPVIALVSGSLYGTGHARDLVHQTISKIAFENRVISLVGQGRYVRDFVYISDFCDAIIKAIMMGNPGETYCIGSGREMTVIDAVNIVCNMMSGEAGMGFDIASRIKFSGGIAKEDSRRVLNTSRAERELQLSCKYSFEEGVRHLLESHKVLKYVA